MKFKIVSKGDERSNRIKATMKQYLIEFDLEYDRKEPDLVISVGGDGTLLEAFHRYVHRLDSTAFIGVHTGHLGFYADWVPDEVEKLIIEIAKTPFQVVEYPLLEVTIRSKTGGTEDRFLALNEATIKTADGSVVFDVEIKGEHFETFRGDGLCISTPSGSTAYNKALGGGIIHPSLDAIQLTEMASINNRVFRTIGSPLILPKHHTALLKPMVDRSFLIAIDHFTTNYVNVKSIQCRVAEERIRFARFRPFPFWNRVRDSFVAEEDD
ncbi:NAD kinase [Virgibacillus halodenitrificans]|uniref:NAD kinase n=1 Tax=Virgibacillus halodenitrificans TaxID=1482 RepID=A0AAC9IYJ6_VIRHA|nr:NAD kinase [Virgibacillus halodenitrificans]APC47524.1 NAD kinase [Virgibacillus halodenitrificans]MCG1028610.1 NAD kinase [Virgibacillus halodenitrificans]MCJ0931979.1 NAD kinase [Virgibacillus halodenitrificans]MEC2158660.1 NAD kinase [Virgibacillus halodenitrificans]MYL44206.1 NAD kinase [Virgibacillus halodenitrificans]